MMYLGFPAERLFDMMMAGGPLPVRFQHRLRGNLSGSPPLEYTPEEVLAMRNCWLSLPSHPNIEEQRSRDACIELTRLAFHREQRCLRCASELENTESSALRCPTCGEAAR